MTPAADRVEWRAPDAAADGIFDHFLVVGLPSRLVEHPDVAVGARYAPKVLHHLSPRGEAPGAEAIADFCLPGRRAGGPAGLF